MKKFEQKHQALIEEAERRGQLSTDNLRACFEVLALSAAIDKDCASRLAPYGLSEGKFVLLFLLNGEPEGLSPHELAERAGVTRATITGLLDGLERDQFINRQSKFDDRRKIAVMLTAKGKQTANYLFDLHTQWISTLFAGFSDQDRYLLQSFLERIRQNLHGTTS
ncbi:MarR family winged helix-turn-helix transcriptional regulator [Brucellaceae bacterium C25G]